MSARRPATPALRLLPFPARPTPATSTTDSADLRRVAARLETLTPVELALAEILIVGLQKGGAA